MGCRSGYGTIVCDASAGIRIVRFAPVVSASSIPLHLRERHGRVRRADAVRLGVPVPRGLVAKGATVSAVDANGAQVPCQASVLASWPDRSAKWLLVDVLADVGASQDAVVRLVPSATNAGPAGAASACVSTSGDAVVVDTAAAIFTLRRDHPGALASVVVKGVETLTPGGSAIRLTTADGAVHVPAIDRLVVEDSGPVRVVVLAEGVFRGGARSSQLAFRSRLSFVANSAVAQVDFLIRHTGAAVHPGGLWDLGDPGSWRISDLSLSHRPSEPARQLTWTAERGQAENSGSTRSWSLYQDSSGGDRWDSPNHVGAGGGATVSFRGYRIHDGETPVGGGHRASPFVVASGERSWLAVAVRDFWQNFPKAVRWKDGELSVGLFPSEQRHGFELQGGEQKRHTLWFEFGTPASVPTLVDRLEPLDAWVDPAWTEQSRALPWFTAQTSDEDPRYAAYVHQIVDGDRSFIARREVIDEYGWRNYGDLYADHEAVRQTQPTPFISHYNNQYDFVFGACFHFLRTGDTRWRDLGEALARHVVDIDIYHTQSDKAAFNGGLFWHTDHYLPAATCTHRTYSVSNGAGGYGGGPSNEHNYTSGLLLYYYLSGDREAASAVRELAEWVLGMDDGERTMFSVLDVGATGIASKTLEAGYHHPGRGAGNSINALVDAYVLTNERRYLAKAESLIQRCIHPHDDIAALKLDDPEHRWSYLVFLQVLARYLLLKRGIGETDYHYHYGRESLLHYADWMVEHEVPYKDVLHTVELPTETWPAHDIRKCHVLHAAAQMARGEQRARYRERARFFFDRCLTDLLGFETAWLTRPLVILAVYGPVQAYFSRYAEDDAGDVEHNHDFGSPTRFIPQRGRLAQAMKRKQHALTGDLGRMVGERWWRLRRRFGR